ncbi:unnamed protein product [Linum tenue]|uniref:GST N-terminal domain-containing protein n=1 Tax=Linum tenue TaxID=586396 RepID=A0AAV0I2U2_9ROSI|nr:unnamed protein product [Linum tenue]
MAGVINVSQFPFLRTISRRGSVHAGIRTSIPVTRASSSSSETPPSSGATTAATRGEEQSAAPSFAAQAGFKTPEPKRFAIRPDKGLDVAGAALAIFFRLDTGVFLNGYSVSFVSKDEIPADQYALELAGYKVKETSKLGPRPEQPIMIYEFEREIVAVLDLVVLFYPCPRNGPNFRPKAIELGGKQQFPYMVDPNTGVAMYESDAIIKYLVDKYGDGRVPLMLSLGLLTVSTLPLHLPLSLMLIRIIRCMGLIAGFLVSLIFLQTLTAGFAMIVRMGRVIPFVFSFSILSMQGQSYRPSKLPPKPLELWAYEGSPFCKLVREVLVELELPHIYRSCGRGSPKR